MYHRELERVRKTGVDQYIYCAFVVLTALLRIGTPVNIVRMGAADVGALDPVLRLRADLRDQMVRRQRQQWIWGPKTKGAEHRTASNRGGRVVG